MTQTPGRTPHACGSCPRSRSQAAPAPSRAGLETTRAPPRRHDRSRPLRHVPRPTAVVQRDWYGRGPRHIGRMGRRGAAGERHRGFVLQAGEIPQPGRSRPRSWRNDNDRDTPSPQAGQNGNRVLDMPQSGWAECRLIQYLRTLSSRRADTVRAAIQAPPGAHQCGLSAVPPHGSSAHGEPCRAPAIGRAQRWLWFRPGGQAARPLSRIWATPIRIMWTPARPGRSTKGNAI
jgi:hypothetical protein